MFLQNSLSANSALPSHAVFPTEFKNHLRSIRDAVDDDVDKLNEPITLLTREYMGLVKSIAPFKNALEDTIKHIKLHKNLLSNSAPQVKGVDVKNLLEYFDLLMHRTSLTKEQAAKAVVIGKPRLIVTEFEERSEHDLGQFR